MSNRTRRTPDREALVGAAVITAGFALGTFGGDRWLVVRFLVVVLVLGGGLGWVTLARHRARRVRNSRAAALHRAGRGHP